MINILRLSIKESSSHHVIVVIFRWWGFLLLFLFLGLFFGFFLWLFLDHWGIWSSSTWSSNTANTLGNKLMNFFSFQGLYYSIDIIIGDIGLDFPKYFFDIGSTYT